jgi:hypothetical protein
MMYFQQSILPETVDVIVVNVYQPGDKRAKGYVFNLRQGDQDVLRLGCELDQITSENVHMMTESLEGLKDLSLQV